MAWTLHNILVRLINVALAFIAFFLGMKILLRLVNANEGTPFVAWIYNVANALARPFQGIFPDITLAGNATFDIVALIALVAYSILAYLLISLVNALLHPDRTTYVHQDHHGHIA